MENRNIPMEHLPPAVPVPPETPFPPKQCMLPQSTSFHSHHPSSPPESSPARSSLSSDPNTITHSPPPGNSLERSSISCSTNIISNHEIHHSQENEKAPEEKSLAVVIHGSVSEEPMEVPAKIESGGGVLEGGGGRFRPTLSILRRVEREKMVGRATLGFRALGFAFCLVSFAVMAANRNQGWALDSFERYIEFRYCMSVNVIGFLYSGAQAICLSYNMATGKYVLQRQRKLQRYFDFALDQIIAYLLISASSSAATRIDDWESNWGEDNFPHMATISVSLSFLAFVAVGSSSLVSGYSLCRSKSL